MAKRISVVVSQGQSANPAKRGLEEDIVAGLLLESGVEVTVIPHLYDLKSDGTGMLALQGIGGDMIVVSWLYERAARWILDRNGIRGLEGKTLIKQQSDDEEDDDENEEKAERKAEDQSTQAQSAEDKARVVDQRPSPKRRIYCLDLQVHNTAKPYIDEVRRIVGESKMQLVQLGGWIDGQPNAAQAERFLLPTNDTALPLTPRASIQPSDPPMASPLSEDAAAITLDIKRISDEAERRWYPVIDYSRCTNCMECIDFCLFGVYGVDRSETILVEQPDNCRKGCPACSRVCPENAIIFPQHKMPAIAGAPVGLVSLKIDLSKLFGAPTDGKSAVEIAALERDEQLMLVGRNPVGLSVGIPKRQEGRNVAPKDDLDALLDALDEANL
jgi:NAD-dependent dihydropyrimidine dehydrogenase PreA subunit